MSATFQCPHCGMSYPVKPVLVGRTVRCTSCKKAFRLREDGIADKVEAEVLPEAPPKPPPPPMVVKPPPPLPPTTQPETTGAHTRTDAMRAKARELNQQQEQARKSLAANLASAASEALRSESIKREEAKEQKKASDRMDKVASAKKKNKEGAVGDIGPAVLTGTGTQEFQNNIVWLGGCLSLVAIVAVFFWMMSWKNPEERALYAYTAEVPKERNRYGERHLAIQERALLRNVPPLVDLGSLHVHSSRRVKIGSAQKAVEEIKGMRHLGIPAVWAPPDKAEQVKAKWSTRFDAATMVQKLKASNLPVVDEATIKQRFTEAGLDADAFDLYMILVRGRPTPNGQATVERIQNGELPEALEIASFNGRHGLLLVDRGREYRTRSVTYEGRLIRFIGSGWDDQWKILDLKTQSEEDELSLER